MPFALSWSNGLIARSIMKHSLLRLPSFLQGISVKV
jgi:hypothetical protein